MNLTWTNAAEIAAWAAVAAIAIWLLTFPLRRRSLGGVLASVVLTGTAASIGAVLGSVRVMLLATHDQATVLVVGATAGCLAAIAAAAAARRIADDRRALSMAVADLGAGRVPQTDGRRLTAELETLRRDLSVTAARLADSRRREEALESARRELVAWVSHDLRTPLAGLRAMSEALEDGVVDAPEQYYKQIRASVDRLTTMVDDLFNLSRIQAGAAARRVEAIPLGDLVSDCLAALEPLARAQGVRLSGRMITPATVDGNGSELNRALTNLVVNAIRHTQPGGVVEVVLDATGDQATVSVRDECGGIAAEDLPRVFDVGYRGELARTPHAADHPAGAGLGLAITRGIVDAHEGHVSVENVPHGCRFVIALPVIA